MVAGGTQENLEKQKENVCLFGENIEKNIFLLKSSHTTFEYIQY